MATKIEIYQSYQILFRPEEGQFSAFVQGETITSPTIGGIRDAIDLARVEARPVADDLCVVALPAPDATAEPDVERIQTVRVFAERDDVYVYRNDDGELVELAKRDAVQWDDAEACRRTLRRFRALYESRHRAVRQRYLAELWQAFAETSAELRRTDKAAAEFVCQCAACKRKLKVSFDLAGSEQACPNCGAMIRLPSSHEVSSS